MKFNNAITNNAHWLLRISVVSVFLYHGILKFSNLEGFATMLPISYTEVVLVALANVGSVLVILGGFRRHGYGDLATRIGAAFENSDGSINVLMDAVPVNGKIQIREHKERTDGAPQGHNRGNGNGRARRS